MNKKIILPLLFLPTFLLFSELQAQTSGQLNISNEMAITINDQPFWMKANRDGKVLPGNRYYNLSDIRFSGVNYTKDSMSFVYGGTDLIAVIGDQKQYVQVNELYAGINLNNWEVNAGLWVNKEQLGGLSTSNGNMASSRNARPHPRVNIGISDYKPLPLIGKHVLFKGDFEEGWLNDNRFINHTHLHKKSFYLKFKFNDLFDLQGGFEHYVMWGGTSINDNIGKLPDSFHAYIKYITGQSGDDEFLERDQKNVAGNQYGTYQAKITYKLSNWKVVFNLSHPFEDLSGVNWRNWRDNLISLHLSSENRDQIITDIFYEFTNTRNQSARTDSAYYWHEGSQTYRKEEYDSYFNNGVYRSGATYHQLATSSPLFYPIDINNGISSGFRSTRFFAHHFAGKGNLINDISWTGMITYIQHLGRYKNPYPEPKIQLSGLFQLTYSGNKLPFLISFVVAGDKIKGVDNTLGIQIMLTKNLFYD